VDEQALSDRISMFLRDASEVSVGLTRVGVGGEFEVDVLGSVTDRGQLPWLAEALELAPGGPSEIYAAPVLLVDVGSALKVSIAMDTGHREPAADLCLRFRAASGEILGYGELTTSLMWVNLRAHLVDPGLLSRWLEEHGALDYLQARRKQQIADVEKDVSGERWAAAAPTAVKDLTDRMRFTSTTGVRPRDLLTAVDERFLAAYPDDVSRAGALLRWFGAGTGRCNGYPIHESIPERMLLTMPPAAVITAVASDEDDGRLLDGAVRLLAGYSWQRAHSAALAALPDLRRRLLDHALGSDDEDKIERARHAFT
jgi:hypothetical protein